MIYFFDTSALVKRYHQESGSHLIHEIFSQEDKAILISQITVLETVAAVNRLFRMGILEESDLKSTLVKLQEDCEDGTILVIELIQDFLQKSKDLILNYHLFAPDAIILSTAVSLKKQSPVFVCADFRSRLLDAARSEGLSTLNPLSPAQ